MNFIKNYDKDIITRTRWQLSGDHNEETCLLGSELKITPAQEPANIIWESKHIKSWRLYWRTTTVIALMLAILFAAFSVIIKIEYWQLNLNMKYPDNVDCDEYYEKYGEKYV